MNPTLNSLPSHKQTREILLREIQELEEKLNQEQRRIYHDLPERNLPMKRLQLRAMMGLVTRSEAIKAKCQQCVAYQNLKEEIGDCVATSCALWHFRPYRNKQ